MSGSLDDILAEMPAPDRAVLYDIITAMPAAERASLFVILAAMYDALMATSAVERASQVKKLVAMSATKRELQAEMIRISVAAAKRNNVPMPEPQSIEDAIENRLELAEHIGELTRNGRPTGTGRLKTVARPIGKGQKVNSAEQPALFLMIDDSVRPIGLDLVIDGVAPLLGGDRRRAAERVERRFAKGFKRRHVRTAGWTVPVQTEEERHIMTLLTTEPTSVDDGGVRKARQRAVKWLEKQGRVIKDG